MVDDWVFDAGIEGGPVARLHDEIVMEVAIEDADLRGRTGKIDGRRLR